MKKNVSPAPCGSARRVRAVAACALLLVLGQAARAQWTQPSSGGHINNTNSGNVGIGTAAPGERLVNTGNAIFGGPSARTELWPNFTATINPALFELNSGAAVAGDTRFAALSLVTHQSGASNVVGAFYFSNSAQAGADKRVATFGALTDGAVNSGMIVFGTAAAGTLAERMRITSAGNVGIGTMTPGNKLTISSPSGVADTLPQPGANGGKFALLNNAGLYGQLFGVLDSGSSFIQTQRVDGAGVTYDLLLQPNGGKVGIGTTSPLGSLHVPAGQVVIGQNYQPGATLRVGRNDANYPGIVTATNYNDGAKPIYRARSNNAAGLSGDGLYTFLAQSDAMVRTFSADHQGNGYFAGDLNVGGSLQAKYQDVAEWVPTTQRLAPGTVVVLDPARSNHVLASASAYDTAVAGVVSAQPGIILGEGGEGRVMVATTGRVRVRVDATKGAIRIGDLLVTSGRPGVAMRSEAVSLGGVTIHRPGTIIGKALEPLAGGAGEILVLLSMQ